MKGKMTFILGSMAGGGAERVTANLVKYFVAQDYSVQIIMLLNDRVDYQLPKEVKLTYISTENRNKFIKPLIWMKELRKHLKASKPNTVISFFSKINLLVLLASLGLKSPVFISERNDPKSDNRGNLIKILTFILYPISKGIIFQTKHAKSCFPKMIQRKSTIIPNPINIKFDFSKEKKLNNTIIAVGKLMAQKNHKLLINAFSLIANKYPEYKIEIYGEGELRMQLTSLISEKKLEDKVFLKGRSSDIYKKIYNSDIFVLSSNYEGLSNALLEAMMLKTPVISTKCAGSNEIIQDGETGRLVEVNNHIELANAIDQTIINYGKAVHMAENASNQMTLFSLENICEKWESFIN